MEEVVGYLFNLQVQVGPRATAAPAPAVGVVTGEAGTPASVADTLRAKGLGGPPPRAVSYSAPDETGQQVRTTEAPAVGAPDETGGEEPAKARPVPPPRDRARPQAPRSKKRRRH